ncbi:hypothetical protein AG1IA_09875 [Rhizoctonia solani AG-1 IA]|uniref:Uncharacterized protein n=1 Tax=Thanatephorus cucumeris (strain AG1-IA) TaxID=983506 RepID=L8WDR1_THACA|nr:hypothetical protein AG1IA_09875 [Rhizoctonia solani AG-1 IA]
MSSSTLFHPSFLFTEFKLKQTHPHPRRKAWNIHALRPWSHPPQHECDQSVTITRVETEWGGNRHHIFSPRIKIVFRTYAH